MYSSTYDLNLEDPNSSTYVANVAKNSFFFWFSCILFDIFQREPDGVIPIQLERLVYLFILPTPLQFNHDFFLFFCFWVDFHRILFIFILVLDAWSSRSESDGRAD